MKYTIIQQSIDTKKSAYIILSIGITPLLYFLLLNSDNPGTLTSALFLAIFSLFYAISHFISELDDPIILIEFDENSFRLYPQGKNKQDFQFCWSEIKKIEQIIQLGHARVMGEFDIYGITYFQISFHDGPAIDLHFNPKIFNDLTPLYLQFEKLESENKIEYIRYFKV